MISWIAYNHENAQLSLRRVGDLTIIVHFAAKIKSFDFKIDFHYQKIKTYLHNFFMGNIKLLSVLLKRNLSVSYYCLKRKKSNPRNHFTRNIIIRINFCPSNNIWFSALVLIRRQRRMIREAPVNVFNRKSKLNVALIWDSLWNAATEVVVENVSKRTKYNPSVAPAFENGLSHNRSRCPPSNLNRGNKWYFLLFFLLTMTWDPRVSCFRSLADLLSIGFLSELNESLCQVLNCFLPQSWDRPLFSKALHFFWACTWSYVSISRLCPSPPSLPPVPFRSFCLLCHEVTASEDASDN